MRCACHLFTGGTRSLAGCGNRSLHASRHNATVQGRRGQHSPHTGRRPCSLLGCECARSEDAPESAGHTAPPSKYHSAQAGGEGEPGRAGAAGPEAVPGKQRRESWQKPQAPVATQEEHVVLWRERRFWCAGARAGACGGAVQVLSAELAQEVAGGTAHSNAAPGREDSLLAAVGARKANEGQQGGCPGG